MKARGRKHVGQRGLHDVVSVVPAYSASDYGFELATQPRIGQAAPAIFALYSCRHHHVRSSASGERQKV